MAMFSRAAAGLLNVGLLTAIDVGVGAAMAGVNKKVDQSVQKPRAKNNGPTV